ncbi:FG-GAP repeat protein [bacterium]|nr:FG-GAP repeat protein [bacterium]
MYKNISATILILFLFSINIVFAQHKVLVDDAPMCGWYDRTTYQSLWDTLTAHGAEIHYTTIEGRFPDLSDYDMVILMHHYTAGGCFSPTVGFNYDQRTQLIDFVCHGGNILITTFGKFFESCYEIPAIGPYGDLFSDPRWVTGLSFYLPYSLYEIVRTSNINPLPPITNGIDHLTFIKSVGISVEFPAYAFVWTPDSEHVGAAISYPYRTDGEDCDCHLGGRIVVLDCAYSLIDYCDPMFCRFIDNITLALARVSEDTLEDCLPPAGIVSFDSLSCANPGDVVNIWGTSIPNSPELVFYFDDEEIDFTWFDSTHISFIVPSDAMQGYHRLTFEYLEVFYQILIKVYCDWLYLFHFEPYCADIGDTVWFFGENILLSATMTFGGEIIPTYSITTDSSGWFIVPDTVGVERQNWFGNTYRYNVCIENAPTQRVCKGIAVPCPCPPDSDIVASIENVRFWERTDGTDTVYIVYDLIADTAQNIVLLGSSDGGLTWSVPCVTVTGAVGNDIPPGDSLVIVWEAGTDVPNRESSDWVFLIEVADSGGSGGGTISTDTLHPPAITFDDDTFWCSARFTGASAWGDLGHSISSAGDVNNDGFDDVIMGDEYAGSPGQAYIFFGGPSLSGEFDASTADVIITGEADWDCFGCSVSSAGDVNNDGFDDVIIGALYNTAGGYAAGRAYIFFGGPTFSGEHNASAADVIITGEAGSDYLGCSVSSAGDVNNDDFDDVIIGAYNNSAGGGAAGRAYIFFGGSTFSGEHNASTADVIITGEASYDYLGNSVSSAGDVNNDNFDDVVIGVYYNSAGGSYAGRAYIFFGSPTFSGEHNASAADVIITGEASYDYLGNSVSSAGDVNNDGFYDVIIGAYANDAGGSDAGRAYIFFGSPTFSGEHNASAADVIITGETSPDNFGCSVSSAGDVNNDGFDDVIIGANESGAGAPYGGRAYIFLDLSTLLGEHSASTADIFITGETFYLGLGGSVSSAGDVNADSKDDVLIAITDSSSLGSVYLYTFTIECPFGAIYCAAESDPGPVDTKHPDVSTICPPDGEIGETATIQWTATDSFIDPLTFGPLNSIRIYYTVDGENYITITATRNDGNYDWVYPYAISNAMQVVVCATDSFGHISCDTCGTFSITGNIIPPSGYIYADSCWPDTIYFVLHDEPEAIDLSSLQIITVGGYYYWGDEEIVQLDDTLFGFILSMVDTAGLYIPEENVIIIQGICDTAGNCFRGEIEDNFYVCEEQCSLAVSIDGPDSLCYGQETWLTLVSSNYDMSDLSMDWQPSDGIIENDGDSILVAPETTTVYRVIAQYSEDCADTVQFELNVLLCESPCTLSVSIDGPTSLCYGQEAWLTLTSLGYDMSDLSMDWQPSDGILANENSRILVRPETTTVYRAIAEYSDDCSDTIEFDIHISFCECRRIPNPFTPNLDGRNDFCQFAFPDMGDIDGTIYIFDNYGIEVKEIEIPAGSKAKELARWRGIDSKGKSVPQGVYTYIIEVGSDVVCEGTVTIAR